jgi:hypothetical protein
MLRHFVVTSPRGSLLPLAVVTLIAFTCFPAYAPALQSEKQATVPTRNANEIFASLGTVIPEFGGMFIDEQNKDTLDIYVLEPSINLAEQLDAAINAIPELAAARAAQPRIRLLPGQYSFVQLKQWHDRMSMLVLAISGTRLTGIDQRWNRLVVKVENPSVETDVVALLAELKVPREAVDIQLTPLVEELPQAQAAVSTSADPPAPKTLQSEIRPLVGGILVAYPEDEERYYGCTLGFIANRDDISGFVINSQCTKVQGGVQNTNYFQPTPAAENLKVGVETVDPCYYIPNKDPHSYPAGCKPVPPPIPPADKCPNDQGCRYSDSAFAAQQKDVTVKLGFIARPVKENTITWDPPDTYFQIVGEQNVMVLNTPVSWVGQISGWRTNFLAAVCMNMEEGDGYTLLCQNLLTSNAGPGNTGDSGSPVFVCVDDSEPPKIVECPGTINGKISNVNLVGIKWGEGGRRQTAYSPIGSMSDGKVKGVQNVANELGPLKKCAEGGC